MKRVIVFTTVSLGIIFQGFSQTTEKPAIGEIAPLAVPAENVELVDIDGRAITVTVLSMAADKQSIVIRTTDGKEMPLLMSKFNAATVEKLLGRKMTKEQALAEEIKRRQAKQQSSIEDALAKAKAEESNLKGLSSQEIAKLFLAKDPKVTGIIENTERIWADQIRKWNMITNPSLTQVGTHLQKNDPEWDKYNFSFLQVLPQMNIKPQLEEERVSLKPAFEKLGIVGKQQEKYNCWLYAGYHLTQYAFLSKGQSPPTLSDLKSRLTRRGIATNEPGGGSATKVIGAINETLAPQKRLNVLWFSSRPYYADRMAGEMIKHQLRNNRACIVSITETIGSSSGNHSVVIIGFHAKDGRTTWEILNSNIGKTQGYETRINWAIDTGISGFSFWIE